MTSRMDADTITVTLKGGVEFTVPVAVVQGFSEEVYNQIFANGLELFLRKGMTNIAKGDAEAVTAKGNENLEQLKEGKLKTSRAKKVKAGVSRAVMTQATKMAKDKIKLEAKRQGIKVSHLDPKEVTAWANQLLDSPQGAKIIAEAEALLAKVESDVSLEGSGIVLASNERRVMQATAKTDRAKAAKAAKAGTKAVAPAKAGFVPPAKPKPVAHANR